MDSLVETQNGQQQEDLLKLDGDNLESIGVELAAQKIEEREQEQDDDFDLSCLPESLSSIIPCRRKVKKEDVDLLTLPEHLTSIRLSKVQRKQHQRNNLKNSGTSVDTKIAIGESRN